MFDALRRLNPDVPDTYLRQARAEILAPSSEDPIAENHRIHDWLVEGFRGITYVDADGQEATPTIRLISTDPGENDWLVANQVTVRRGEFRRRFDSSCIATGCPSASSS
jgi:type I restriction enzyme, R subunit